MPVFLLGESPWTEEPGGLQFTALQRVDTAEWLSTVLLLLSLRVFFSLSMVLVSFMMILLSIVFLFSVLAAHWTTWVYGIMDFIKFGKLWAIISINMLYFPFLLCFRDSHDIYWCYSRVYWCSTHYYNYILFLWFILESFHCYVFKFTSLFFSCLICC